MRYIIERSLALTDSETILSYLIDSQHISYVSQSPLRMNVMKVSMKGFKMIPGLVSPLMSLNTMPVEIVKQRLADKLRMGTTTLLTSARISYLHEAEKEISRTRHLLISSPIDYSIGLSIPPHKLTPDIIRFCKRKRVPFIELVCDDFISLKAVVWERIREANFPFQAVIFPTFKALSDEKKIKVWRRKWNDISAALQIPTLSKGIDETDSLPLPYLKLLGLYPKKGGLFTGSDVDYCLIKDTDIDQKPSTVVVRGTIIFSEKQLDYCQGFGKEITIVQPGRFGVSAPSRV
jgi:hypothetical protein